MKRSSTWYAMWFALAWSLFITCSRLASVPTIGPYETCGMAVTDFILAFLFALIVLSVLRWLKRKSFK